MESSLIVDRFVAFLQRRPLLLRTLLRFGHSVDFINRVGRSRLATRGPAVREVFDRPEDFLMGYRNGPKMKLGTFILGMDPGKDHKNDRDILSGLLDRGLELGLDGKPGGFRAVATAVSQAAGAELLKEKQTGEVDLALYAERVLARSLADFYGIPRKATCTVLDAGPMKRNNPKRTEMLGLFIRTMGSTIANRHPAPFGLEALADEVKVDFKKHLLAAVCEQRKNRKDNTIIGQLIATNADLSQVPSCPASIAKSEKSLACPCGAKSCNCEDIARNIGGMLSASAGFPLLFASAVHELLKRPEELAVVIENADLAITSQDATKRQTARRRVDAHVREANRFKPVFTLLNRHCPRATALHGPEGEPATELPAGQNFALSPLSAMFDPDIVERPDEFIPGRPAETYMLFGRRPRVCIAEEHVMALFAPMLDTLFKQVPAIKGAKPGRFRYDGPALESYVVKLAQG